ncbi:hypothetical protein [Prosthecobacter sp.]|uniref:hypothetical protein n=1 Tax=Prosthecobacter sp. TaxID=1965333 RepID=UPI00378436F8
MNPDADNNSKPFAASTTTSLKHLRYEQKPKGSWKGLVGTMKGCDLSEEAFRLGAEWREQMNRDGR